jgi:hypothetical protein
MNLKQFTILLLGCELEYMLAGWPATIGIILGAAVCLTVDAVYERRKSSKSTDGSSS